MRVFRKLLVANRGEIARRIIATARDMGTATVALYSDADAGAPHRAEADESVHLPGVRAADTYLDVARVVEAACRTGADALHPGYGFLAESPELASACRDAGIVFVGPPVEAMLAMSRKVEAKALASGMGIPVLATLPVDPGRMPGDDELGKLTFPLLVKASAGGGGTGIGLVEEPGSLGAAAAAASRDALAAFGDGAVFLEPLVRHAHHVEVQILSDGERTVHLFERECSVQRRHQKVVEEAPSPTISVALRDRMTGSAVALARAVGYVGAGTVEFLVEGDRFFFLEMNTRLQVEHRVTECVTGIDLVRAQLEIAAGQPLFFGQEEIALRGHAVEARLYAEDPANDYAPTAGTILHYAHGHPPGVLFDDAIATGVGVTAHYDGLLSKVVAAGAHRAEAVARLARAVRSLQLDGIVTNRRLLAAVLGDPEFLAGGVDTGYLDRRPELATDDDLDAGLLAVHAAAVARCRGSREHARSPLSFAPLGWRNVVGAQLPLTLHAGRHTVSVTAGSGGEVRVDVDRGSAVVSCAHVAPVGDGDDVDVTAGGVVRRCAVRAHGDRWSVNTAEGQSDFTLRERSRPSHEDARDGVVTAPVPGTVTSVTVASGDVVNGGDVVVVIEAMKMEHRVTAPFDGVVVAATVAPGDVVDAHQVVVTVARPEDDPEPGT
jgi:propionyl-CoA carboxylase alpha chain